MRAAVYQGSQQFAIEDMADPTPGPGQVVIDVNYCAICGTDVHHFLYDIAPPGTVMGHEYSGVVSAVGDGVARWSVGDRVVGGGGEPPPAATRRYAGQGRTLQLPAGTASAALAEGSAPTRRRCCWKSGSLSPSRTA